MSPLDPTQRITIQGIGWNLFLTAFKGTAAWLSGSKALLADALESASDIIVSLGVLFGLRVAARPTDVDHPYGHGKIESIVAQVIGFILLAAAAGILYYGVVNTLQPPESAPHPIALWAALITIIIKEVLFRYTLRVGRASGSPSVTANAWGHRSDAYSSVVTLIGVGGAIAGLPILDPIAASVVSIFIFKMAYNIIRESSHDLMDGALDDQLLRQIAGAALEYEAVAHTHRIRGRRSGQRVWIDLTVEMDPGLTIEAGHTEAHKLKAELMGRFDVIADIMIHVNPHLHPHTHHHE